MDAPSTLNNYVLPRDFVARMEKHWTEELGNVSSHNLKRAWERIATVFMGHIRFYHDDPVFRERWNVLSPPTGSGKTESAVMYCAMLADVGEFYHPGVLIVTRLIEDCNAIAARINRFGSRETAVAFHSESLNKLTDLRDSPVVVITHSAYERALDFLGSGGEIAGTWEFFHDWMTGTRRLVIIDECIDVVDHNAVSLDRLRSTVGQIPLYVRERHSHEIKAIESMLKEMERSVQRAKTGEAQETMLRAEALAEDIAPDLTNLIKALDNVFFDYKVLGKEDLKARARMRERCKQCLKALHYTYRAWIYCAGKGEDYTLNTARLLIPDGAKGAVVLDATADVNAVYDVGGKRFNRIPTPQGVRSYRNFTLHVSRDHKVGKGPMVADAKKLTGSLIQDLNGKLGNERQAFIVCHKDVEPILNSWDTSFDMSTGHWGAIDGSNGWRDCDTVVIFGLNYLPKTWTANIFMALNGPQDTEWLRDKDLRGFGGHEDIRKALANGHLATTIIQAINRISCRKVVDSSGNCPESEGYILLPYGELADTLLDHIRRSMPDINIIEDWTFEVSKAKTPGKRSKSNDALVKFIENMGEGKVSKGVAAKRLGMNAKTVQRQMATASDPGSDIHAALERTGVRYEIERKGKTQYAYFINDI